jgi:phosphonate transport system permease protein
VIAALVVIWTTGGSVMWANVVRFFTVDALPAPLHEAGPALPGLLQWGGEIVREQALPGIAATVVLTQLALVLTGVLTLVFFPLVSRRFFGPVGRTLGHVFLVVMRSTPEYVLAYILLVLLGPSMLPAILALALHNGAIIGHLTGRHTDQLLLRPDAPRGLNLYGYEVLPRVYGQFLAFLFYRWEVIMRETAILGILGIHTLGFYVDSAFAEIRVDRALFLIGITALLNLGIDGISRRVRAGLKLSQNPDAV